MASDNPLETFSHCHAGIFSRLQALDLLPALLEPARRARQIAGDSVDYFRRAVYAHHEEEERELFPAVLASATAGAERERVDAMVEQLTREHRRIEAAWERLEPGLKAVAKGHDEGDLRGEAIEALVHAYEGHARYEESEFLPLAQQILGRNSNHMAALGVSLHLRHALPQVLARYGSRI